MAKNHKSRNLNNKPVIGIAPCYKPKENAYWHMAKEAYSHAVWDVEGIPVILTYPNSNGSVEESVKAVDAVMMIGGADLPIEYYKGQPYDLNGETPMHKNRIDFDRKVYTICKQKGIPVLAICAGIQHVNVIHGGTLYEDIPTQVPNAVNHGEYRGKISHHPIDVHPESLLHDIIGDSNPSVNSTHHQAIQKLGQDLKVTARTSDGLIEAVESVNSKVKLIGVQWHPELMRDDPRQLNLFRWLVEEAGT